MKTIDDALAFADTFDKPANKHMSIVMLAAEVRRLREQATSDDITIELLEHRLESFRDDNARLREENQPQSLSSWQPIATAPKDGTDILVMTRETMHVARWENIHGDFDYWVVDDNKHGPFTLRGKEPTHWMPLPEPAP